MRRLHLIIITTTLALLTACPSGPRRFIDTAGFDTARFVDFTASLHVHNAGDDTRLLTIRRLKDTVELDCDVIDADPAGLLAGDLFAKAEQWEARKGVNIALSERVSCAAALVSADNSPTPQLIWRNGATLDLVFGQDRMSSDGEVRLADDGIFRGGVLAGPLRPYSPPDDACEPQPDGDRIDWHFGPKHTGEVESIETLPGGCTSILFRGAATPARICGANDMVPFTRGSYVNAVHDAGHLALTGANGTVLRLTRGLSKDAVPELGERAGQDKCTLARDDCNALYNEGFVAITGVKGQPKGIRVGQTRTFEVKGRPYRYRLVHHQIRSLVDTDCSSGAESLGADIETVMVIE